MSTQKTVLLVEDNPAINQLNRRVLQKAGYRVLVAEDLAGARALLGENRPHAIVLDIELPDGNGLDFIPEIRRTSTAPVLLLTAMGTKDERIAGLRAGGDDYITKPYDLDELRERVAAFIRRGELVARHPSETMERGPLVLNMACQQALLNDNDMKLTPKEFGLLLALLRNEGKVLSKRELYEEAWRAPMLDDGNALFRQVSGLKKKLGGTNIELFAERGQGYAIRILK